MTARARPHVAAAVGLALCAPRAARAFDAEVRADTQAQAYQVRAGGVVADAALGLEEVMQLRFGDPLGRYASTP